MAQAKDSDYARIADPVLLEKVDKLFACNVGELIDLPQLVVVGDQSSGKSSVLAGLTKLPFPSDSGLCTRFATQMTFRRSSDKSIRVSVIPGSKSTVEHAEAVRSWGIEIEKLDAESFAEILAEVHGVMGISTQDQKGRSGLSTFSDDVLRLEISGPEEEHLSIIDVPGIFKNTTPGVTSKKDIQTEILEIAKELDPQGDRTLGVLTKPDLVDVGAEKNILEMLNGNTLGIKLGWNIVRNPGQRDLDDGKVGRYSEESFFRDETPWNTIDKDKAGVESLRVRLQDVLTRHIRNEFPKVRSEINKRLETSREVLAALGAERATKDQQRSFLLDLVMKFQDAVTQALQTNYAGNDIFDKGTDLRMATLLVNREERFSEQMGRWGQRYVSHSEDEEPESAPEEEDEPESSEKKLPAISVRTTNNLPELDDFLHGQETMDLPKRGILAWIDASYCDSRGFEIGTFSASLLAVLMKKQSEKWKGFALGYISDAITIVHKFISEVLEIVCADPQVHQNLMSFLMDDLVGRYKNAIEQANFLLSVEMNGFPRTLNHYLSDNLQKRRQERNRKKLEENVLEG